MSYRVTPGVTAYQALGFGLSDLNPAKYIGKGVGYLYRHGGRSALSAADKAVKAGAKLVCKAVQTPGAAQGAAVASGGVGTVAVIVASGKCPPGQVPVPMMPPQSDLMMPLLLGGMALAIIFVVTQPKKKKAAPTP
jgi:hypothetical protein